MINICTNNITNTHTHTVRKDGVELVSTVAVTHTHGNMFPQEGEARGKMITALYEGSDG